MTSAALTQPTLHLRLLTDGNAIPVRAEFIEASDPRQRILSPSKEECTRPEEYGQRSTRA